MYYFQNIPHTSDAIRAAAHFGDFFVERARRLNRHRFNFEIGKKAWVFAKLQPGRARKRINAT